MGRCFDIIQYLYFISKLKRKSLLSQALGRLLLRSSFAVLKLMGGITHPPVREEENMTMSLSDNYDYQPFQNLKL